MKLTSALFEAFLKCPTKCYLRSTGQAGTGNAYAEWLKSQNEAYRGEATKQLDVVPEAERVTTPLSTENLKTATWRLALDVLVQAGGIESRLHAVERVPSQGRGRPVQFIPVRFIPFNKLTKDDRLMVAFDALALSEALARPVKMAKIIHGDDHAALKVSITSSLAKVRKLTTQIAALLGDASTSTPLLIRHCGECEFRDGCRQQALEKDDLSLLSNMTGRERQKLNSEGIFTLTQLSYTFRPRRRPKRWREKCEKYHHALKALAIRERKIHIVGSPELKIEGTPVYLDVEGLPDRDFYYLIGLRVKSGGGFIQHSFWADDFDDQRKLWCDFLTLMGTLERPVLIHYGSFETTFLRRMSERYGGLQERLSAAKAIKDAINLLSVIYAQIYFPTHTNGLKEIGSWMGYKWTTDNPSGTQSIIWRMDWEKSGAQSLKQELITYNSEDCQALEKITEALVNICSPGHLIDLQRGTDPNIVLAERPTSKDTLWPRFSSGIESLETINKAARWDFQRQKVYIRTDKLVKRASNSRKLGERRIKKINEELVWYREPVCPRCGKRMEAVGSCSKTVYDIRFSRLGVRRWVVTYHFKRLSCRHCNNYIGTPEHIKPWGWCGRKLVMFMMYKIIELGMAQRSVAQELNRLFGVGLQDGEVHRFKGKAAEYYSETRATILGTMLKGQLIHADETPIVLKHKRGYVWTFASFHEVVYFYTETREGNFVEEKLREFKGVLISDFYAPYDALPCPQQKCLIHLIRDLNDSVLDSPYDEELKTIITGFAELLRGIVQTIDQWGLKRRFLRRHLVDVNRFYRNAIKVPYRGEAAQKWRDRFEKNRDGLFTFLNYDGIPWNNNNAEHAIKAFARLRRAILGLSTAKGIDEYLVLLSICQTCKYSGLDFLDFLLSGEKDIDAYARKRMRGKKSASIEQFATVSSSTATGA